MKGSQCPGRWMQAAQAASARHHQRKPASCIKSQCKQRSTGSAGACNPLAWRVDSTPQIAPYLGVCEPLVFKALQRACNSCSGGG